METWNYCPARETRDGNAGSLVLHIRSGDIFHQSPLFAPFGQVRILGKRKTKSHILCGCAYEHLSYTEAEANFRQNN